MKKLAIRSILFFILLFILFQDSIFAKEDYNKYNPQTDPTTGIISYVQESYADDWNNTKQQTQPVPIPKNRKSYLEVTLYAYCDGWWSEAYSRLYENSSVILRNNNSWSGVVSHSNYSIKTYAYQGMWGTSLARATVKIYPYFNLGISVENSNCGFIYIDNNHYQLGKNYEYKAGTTVTLRAEPKPGCSFIRWEGSVSSTSPTINVMMNDDKNIKAVFADIHVDDVSKSDAPISYIDRKIRLDWNDVEDVSGIKEYQVMVTEEDQEPSEFDGLIRVSSSEIVLENLSSKKNYYGWIKAVDNAGNISKNWLKIGPFSPLPENPRIDDKNCFSESGIQNNKAYYMVEIKLEPVDAAYFIIQRSKQGSDLKEVDVRLTYEELQKKDFKYIDDYNLEKHAEYCYTIYTENAKMESVPGAYQNVSIKIKNIPVPEEQITAPDHNIVTNEIKHLFKVPTTDIEGDEIHYRVRFPESSNKDTDELYGENEITFPGEGEWKWQLEIAEYYEENDKKVLVEDSIRITMERTLYIDQTPPTGAFTFITDGKEGFANKEKIKLYLNELKDKSGLFNSGIARIYLWNDEQYPGLDNFEEIDLSEQIPKESMGITLDEEILSKLAAADPTKRKGLCLKIPKGFKDSLNIELDWRLISGDDGQRNVFMELGDLAGNKSERITTQIRLDTTPPNVPVFSACTFDEAGLVFNWSLHDTGNDLDTFYVIFNGKEENVGKVLEDAGTNVFKGSFHVPITYQTDQDYNKEVEIGVYATDLAGNKSPIVALKGYTKAKPGEVGIITSGYSEENKHYFMLPVLGGIAKKQVLEITTDSRFEEKVTRVEAINNLFLATLLEPHGKYYYRLLAFNGDDVPTVGPVGEYIVPNQAPPIPEIISPVKYASTDVKFIFTRRDADVDGDSLDYYVYLDKGDGFVEVPWDEQQACYCVTLPPEGHGKIYRWYIKVVDDYSRNNDDSSGIVVSEEVEFQLDAIAPVLTLKKPDTIYTNQAEIEFIVEDDLSGVQTIEYQLTDAANNQLIDEAQTLDPATGKIPLPEGYYHLTVTAIDQAGNQITEQINNLRVDRTKPQLTGVNVSLPDNGSEYLANTTRIPLAWTAVDEQSGIAELRYWVLTAPNQPLSDAKKISLSPSGGTYALSLDLGVTNGRCKLVLAVLDRAGNQSDTTELTLPILLDTTPPAAVFKIEGLRAQGAAYYLTPNQQLTLITASGEDPESGIAEESFTVVDTGAKRIIDQSPDWRGILDAAFVSGNSYQIVYRVTNKVGLTTEVESVEFIYDQTPPEELRITRPQTALAKGETGIFLAAATEKESRIARYLLAIGSAANPRELTALIPGNTDGWITIDTNHSTAEFRLEIPEIDDGTYYLTLAVENTAGLRATIEAGTIEIDNQQERIIVNDQGPYSMFDHTITGFWHYTGDRAIKAYRYRLIDQDGNGVPNADWRLTSLQSATFDQLNLVTGKTYRFEVKAVFADDTESASGFSPGVTIDTSLPKITLFETPKYATPWNLAFQWEGNDPESGISRVQVALGSDYYKTDLTKGWVDLTDSHGKLSCDANGQQLEFDLEQNNRYYLTLRLVNGAGLATELVSPCIIIDDSPPPVPVVVDQGSYINTSIHQPLEANWFWTPQDPESGNVKYEYTILRYGETLTPQTSWFIGDDSKKISLTMEDFPRKHGETYYVAVRITNGAGLSSIGYSDGIMVDENAPFLTKVILVEAANLGDAEAPEVNYITDNKNLGLWIDSYDPESNIDSYLYAWGKEEEVDDKERLVSDQELIRLIEPEIPEGVVTIFLGETKNGAQIESATGYSTGVVLDTGAPKIRNVRGCLTGNHLLFDWEVEESISPVVRYEYVLVKESDYTRIINNGDQAIPWQTAPDLSRSLVLSANEIADGRYYLIVRGYNAAGTYSRNQGEIMEWGTSPLLVIDRTPPVIIAEEFKTPQYVDEVLKVRVGAEDTLSGIHSYQFALGKSTDLFFYTKGWVDVENNNSLIELPVISTRELPHNTTLYLTVRVKDNVGLWSAAKISPAIIVDHTKPFRPQVTCGKYTTDQSKVTGISFFSQDPESGLTHYRLGIVKTPTGGEWLFTKVVELQEDGEYFSDLIFDQLQLEEGSSYYLAVETRNGAGAWSETGYSEAFMVDTICPELTFVRGEETIVLNEPPIVIEYVLTEDATVKFTLLGADGVRKEYSFAAKEGANLFTFSEDIPQIYTLSAEPADAAGNTGEVKTQSIRVNAPPRITLAPEIYTTPGAPTEFVATVTDPDGEEGDVLRYEWDPGDGSDIIQGEKAEHRYTNTITDYLLTLRVTDKDGGVAEATTLVKVRNTGSGTLYMDEYWTGEHYLYGSVTVPEGVTLTIQPGTKVIVDRTTTGDGYGHRLIVKGNLVVEGGSPGAVICSINPEGVGWEGIYLEGQAQIDGLTLSQAMRGITVSDTGILSIINSVLCQNFLGVHCFSPQVVIENTQFIHNVWYGLKEEAGSRVEVRNCIFSHNGTHYYHVEKTDLTETEINALAGNEGNKFD